MKINHNIAALNAFNQLNKNQSSISKSLEKLSSGKRINKAADDAAGMAIAQKLDTQVRGLDVATRNASDGISVIQTAEGALNEVHSMLQRMRELSIQAANGTLTNDDRMAVQDEMNQLKTEINRISDSTEFNTRKLLNGDIDKRSSSTNSAIAQLSYISDVVKPGKYDVKVTTAAKQEVAKGGAIPTPTAPATGPTAGTIYLNNERIDIASGDSFSDAFGKLRDLADKVGINLYSSTTPPAATSVLTFINKEYGTTHPITISGDINTLKSLGIDATTSTAGVDVAIDTTSLPSPFPTGTTVEYSGNEIKLKNSGDFEIRLKGATVALDNAGAVTTPAAVTGTVSIEVLSTGPMNLQIGANANQTLEIRVGNTSTTAMGITDINVLTESNAENCITKLDEAIQYVSRFRSKLGAYQNRLEHTVNNLTTANENMTASLSRIEDTDMAQEMAEYTKNNILIQAGTSMLSQANQLPQGMLQLLNR